MNPSVWVPSLPAGLLGASRSTLGSPCAPNHAKFGPDQPGKALATDHASQSRFELMYSRKAIFHVRGLLYTATELVFIIACTATL